MKIFTVSIVLLFCSLFTFAQVTIKGRVADQHESLPFATVVLLNSDSATVRGIAADINGEFVFDKVMPGDYRVATSMVGYIKSVSQVISVGAKAIVLTEMILQEEAAELKEVVVSASKPLFEQQMDRLVMNVQSSITSSGNTLLEVLQKAPGVVVNRQNNSISMNGKSGVRVMINGKLMQLPLDVVVQMLDGMASSNVDKIELITTPTSKYDAEGNAGIIHIVTKESPDLGTYGSFGLTAGARWAENLGGNINVNHRNRKAAYFLDYSIVRNHNLHLQSSGRQTLDPDFNQTVYAYSYRPNITTQQNLSAGLEWKLGNSTTLNFLATGYRRNWVLTALTTEDYRASANSTIITDMNITETNIWQSATGAVGLETKINSKSDLSFSLDYLYYHNHNPSRYNNESHVEQTATSEVSTIDLQKSTPIRFGIANVDYSYAFSPSLTLEAGIKGVASRFDNHVQVQRGAGDQWVVDPFFTSSANLLEQMGAGYVSTKWQGHQWQGSGGLRYEYTHTAISTPTEKNLINRKYGYVFPSLFLRRDLGQEKDFQVSYSRRISRPTYGDMAPFVFFWGPNTFSSGNPSLYPALADGVKAEYHVRQWILSLQFTHSRNEISAWQPEVDQATNNLTYRAQNLKYLNTLGLTNTYSVTVTPWWEVQSSVTAQYQTALTSHLQDNASFHIAGLNLNLVSVWRLPRDYSIEISGLYQSKKLSGISQLLPLGSLNAGVQKKFGDKGVVKLSMDDILYSTSWTLRTDLNHLNSYFIYDWHNQYVRLTYTKNFGNNKLKSVKMKSGSVEERGRVGN